MSQLSSCALCHACSRSNRPVRPGHSLRLVIKAHVESEPRRHHHMLPPSRSHPYSGTRSTGVYVHQPPMLVLLASGNLLFLRSSGYIVPTVAASAFRHCLGRRSLTLIHFCPVLHMVSKLCLAVDVCGESCHKYTLVCCSSAIASLARRLPLKA